MDHRGKRGALNGAKIRGSCLTFGKQKKYECSTWNLGIWASIYLVDYRLVVFRKQQNYVKL